MAFPKLSTALYDEWEVGSTRARGETPWPESISSIYYLGNPVQVTLAESPFFLHKIELVTVSHKVVKITWANQVRTASGT